MPKEWADSHMDLVDREGHTYYRNVFAFTNRLRVATTTRDAIKVKQIIDTCSRGEAAIWWNTQLDRVRRTGIIMEQGIAD